jgi:thiol-disulfide isomerase/thioredoxin
MVVRNGPQAAKKGSMLPFWLIVASAGAILVIYVGIFMSHLGGSLVTGVGPMDPISRRAAPPAILQPVTPAGDPVQLLATKGDVVVLHFWGTWCAPCREEFPEFAKFATSDQVPRGVDVFAISCDDKPGDIPKFVSRLPKSPIIYEDLEGLSEHLQVTGYPTTILLDKAGRVAWRSMGKADWSSGGVPAVIEKLREE